MENNNQEYENISYILKILNNIIEGIIKEKDNKINKLLEENLLLKNKIIYLNQKKKSNIKNKSKNIKRENLNDLLNKSYIPKSSKLKEMNDFFNKEYQKYISNREKIE